MNRTTHISICTRKPHADVSICDIMFRLALLHDISGDAARKHVALGDIPARRDDELDLCLIGSFDEVTLDGRVEGARGEECRLIASFVRTSGACSGRRGCAARQRDAHGHGVGELDQEAALRRRVRGQHAATRAARVRATRTHRRGVTDEIGFPVLNSCSKRRHMLKPRNTLPAAFTTRQHSHGKN